MEIPVVDQISAAIARFAVPVAQVHVGTLRVIRFQHPRHDQKEVVQSYILQGLTDRPARIPFAQHVVTDMGMTNFGHAATGTLVERQDAVTGTLLTFLLPLQPNRKTSQINTLQLDRLGPHFNRPLLRSDR